MCLITCFPLLLCWFCLFDHFLNQNLFVIVRVRFFLWSVFVLLFVFLVLSFSSIWLFNLGLLLLSQIDIFYSLIWNRLLSWFLLDLHSQKSLLLLTIKFGSTISLVLVFHSLIFRFFWNQILMFDSISERVSVWWLYFYYSFLVHLGLKSCFKNDSFLKSTFYILFSAIDFVLFLFLILTLKNSVYCLPSNLDWSFLFSMFFWIPFFRFFQSLVLMFDSFLQATHFQHLHFYHCFLIVWLLLTLVFSCFLKLTLSILSFGIDSLHLLDLFLAHNNHFNCLPSNLNSSFPFSFFFILPPFRFFRNPMFIFDSFLQAISFWYLHFYYCFLTVWSFLTSIFYPFLESTLSIPSSRIDSHDFRSFLLTHKNHSNCFPSNPDQSLPFSFLFILPPFSIFDFYCSRSIRI